jgi:hypothetical protein
MGVKAATGLGAAIVSSDYGKYQDANFQLVFWFIWQSVL